jgi:hypothetical protein
MTKDLHAARHTLRTALLAAAETLHTAGSALLDVMGAAPKAATQEDWEAIGAVDDLHFRLVDLSEQLDRAQPREREPQLNPIFDEAEAKRFDLGF